jgi:glycosyltransferase involved in cell wall biosynthesis
VSAQPLVTFVMPAWNPRAEHFAAAVESVLGQHGCEVEVIVVDDGSEPPLAAPDDPRLRVVRVEHGGPYRARNAALELARGDFVRYADADDVLEPESTARLLALAGRGETVAYGATLVCDADLRPVRTMVSDVEGRAERACLLGRFHVRLTSLLFPRRVVEAVGQWDTSFRVSGDWDYVLRALEHARVRGDGGVATLYRRHAGSLTRRADTRAGEEARRRVIERYFERHPELRGTRLEREARAAMLLAGAVTFRQLGDRRGFWGRVARAAPLDPRATGGTLARLAAARVRRATR